MRFWAKDIELRHTTVVDRVANVILWATYIAALGAFVTGCDHELKDVTGGGTGPVTYWGYWVAIALNAVLWCVLAWLPGRAVFYIMTGR